MLEGTAHQYFISYMLTPAFHVGNIQFTMNIPLKPMHLDEVRKKIVEGAIAAGDAPETYVPENVMITHIYKFE